MVKRESSQCHLHREHANRRGTSETSKKMQRDGRKGKDLAANKF